MSTETFFDMSPIFVRADVVTSFTVEGSFHHDAPSDLDYYGYSEFEVDGVEVVNEETGKVNDVQDVFFALNNVGKHKTFPGSDAPGRYYWYNFCSWFEIVGEFDGNDEFVCWGLNLDRALSALKELIESNPP